jgi:predicted XRE-type DNA-binding protein
MEDILKKKVFANVWDALEGTPEEAARMTVLSSLMIAIEQRVRGWNLTQAEAARRLGITQPRLNDLLRGKIEKFSADALLELAVKAGLKVHVDIQDAA